MNGYAPISGSLQTVWDRIVKADITQPTVLTATKIMQFIGDDAGWIVVAYQSSEPGVVMILDHRSTHQPSIFHARLPEPAIAHAP